MRVRFVIQSPEGAQVRGEVGGTDLRIGSQEDCDVVLDGLLPVHLLVARRGRKVWVASTENDPARDRNGSPILGAFIPRNEKVRFAGYELRLRISSLSPSFLLAGIVLAVLLLAVSSSVSPASPSISADPRPPVLFVEETECNAKQASHHAESAELRAIAKQERLGFDLRDGVMAASLFAESADCYQKAGRKTEAARVRQHSRRLQEELNEKYRYVLLRLERALDEGDALSALAQIRSIKQLLAGRHDDQYMLRLGSLERKLESETLRR